MAQAGIIQPNFILQQLNHAFGLFDRFLLPKICRLGQLVDRSILISYAIENRNFLQQKWALSKNQKGIERQCLQFLISSIVVR